MMCGEVVFRGDIPNKGIMCYRRLDDQTLEFTTKDDSTYFYVEYAVAFPNGLKAKTHGFYKKIERFDASKIDLKEPFGLTVNYDVEVIAVPTILRILLFDKNGERELKEK